MNKESVKNYVKTKITYNKSNLKTKYEQKQLNAGETIILTKILNTLKYEADQLNDEALTRENILDRAETIEKIGYIIENFKELEPVIQKFCAEQSRIKKFEEER